MIFVMVDDRSMRFRQQVMPPIRPVQPTRRNAVADVNALMRGTDTRSGYSRADQDLANRRGGELFLSPMSTLLDEAKNTGAVQRGTPLSAGLTAGAFVADLLNPSFGLPIGVGGAQVAQAAPDVARGVRSLNEIGVRGPSALVMAAADPAGAQAARNIPRFEPSLMNMQTIGGLDIPVENSSGIYAAILRHLGRHRSNNPNLGFGVKHPRDVPIERGRAGGAGTYFGDTQETSDMAFNTYGNEVYRIREPLTNVWNTVRNSPGYLTPSGLQKLFPESNAAITASTEWDAPIMQQLRDLGYLGYRYSDNAFTDWTVGAQPFVGLQKVGGTPLPEVLANRLGSKEAINKVDAFLSAPFTRANYYLKNAARGVESKISRAQEAAQNSYRSALRQYQDAERKRLVDMFGPTYDTGPGLMPPTPPGYVPNIPPKEPGVLDFLRELFNNSPTVFR